MPQTPSPAAAPPPLLLFVEDSEPDFRLMSALLRSRGLSHDALRCDTATRLEELLQQKNPAVLIADYALPGLPFEEVLERLRRLRPQLPLIIVSGQVGEDAIVRAMRAGAQDYVMKSNLRRLPVAIDRCLRESEERARHARTEAALSQVRHELSLVFEVVPMALILLDSSDRVRVWNPGAEQLLGLASAQMLGERWPISASLDAHPFVAWLTEAREGHTVRQRRLELTHQSGKELVVLASVHALPGSVSEDPGACAVVLSDVTALEHARQELEHSQTRLRDLSIKAEHLREVERATMAREIHDDLGALVTRIRAELALARRRVEEAQAQQHLHQADALVGSLGQSISRIARELRPPILDHGLLPALEWQSREFARYTGIQVDLHASQHEIPELPVMASTALFRIYQEALTNVFKHAGARMVRVELFFDGEAVTLEIRDDGRGFDRNRAAAGQGFGLRGMSDRVEALGGWIDLSSRPGHGTTLMISVPLSELGIEQEHP